MSTMILAVSALSDGGVLRHEKITAFPVVVGRSPACDVIVADIYVAARQYMLRGADTAQDTWEISALDSVNPTYLNGKALTAGHWSALVSGDEITAGETVVTVYAPGHHVAEAQAMTPQTGVWSALARMPVAALLFVLALAVTAGWSYLDIWSNEAAMTAAMSVSGVFAVIVIWASLWAVVSRLLTHRARFAAQLSLASLYIMVSLALGMVLRAVDFLLSGNLLAQAVTLVCQTGLLAVLTFFCLAAATSLSAPRRRRAAVSFAGGLLISIVSMTAISNMGFNPVPPFSPTLSPGLARFVPADAAGQFIDDSQSLFEGGDSVVAARAAHEP